LKQRRLQKAIVAEIARRFPFRRLSAEATFGADAVSSAKEP
jgi:hypothetical protein